MSVGIIKRLTANYDLRVPNFDMIGWGREIERDLDIIDAVLFAATGIGDVKGVWTNSTIYNIGDRLVDAQDGRIYQALVMHTSAAAPTLFAQDRAANPTYWQILNADVHNRGQWTGPGTDYNENEFVSDNHRIGITLKSFTSGASYDADVAAGNIETVIDLSFYANIPADGYVYGAENTTWKRLPTAAPAGDWKFDTTVGGAPSSGFIRYNNATLASVTAIHVHKTDANALVQTPLITLIAQAGVDLFFGSNLDENTWDVFNVIALPTDAGAYFTIPVVYKSSGTGGALANTEQCRLSPIGGAGSKVVTDDTAPTGPLDGQMWWRSSNGKLYVFYDDGTGAGQWVEASGALGTADGQNLAGYSTQVSNTAAQSINAGVATLVTNMTTVDHDPSGYWNGSRFQPTKAGLYLVYIRATMNMEASKQLLGFLYKNGALYASGGTVNNTPAGAETTAQGTVIVPMNGSTDYLEMFVNHNNSVATNLIGNPATKPRYTSFSAAYLGEAGLPQPSDETALQENLIVNANHQISQQNGNVAATTDAYYAADEWRSSRVTSAGVASFGRVISRTPRKSQYRLRYSVTTIDAALAAGEFLIILHTIEGSRLDNLGWDGATGTQLVLRFGFRGPAGTYSASFRNAGGTRSYVQNFTVTSAQANTDIEVVMVIPPDTTGGTWPVTNVLGATLAITLAAGTTFVAAPNAWQTGNFLGGTGISNGWGAIATFELFDVGLYPDPEMTGVPPEWIAPLFTDALDDCLRYWAERVVIVETNALMQNMTLPVTMRIGPTITGGGAGFTVHINGSDIMAIYQTTRASPTLTFSSRM